MSSFMLGVCDNFLPRCYTGKRDRSLLLNVILALRVYPKVCVRLFKLFYHLLSLAIVYFCRCYPLL